MTRATRILAAMLTAAALTAAPTMSGCAAFQKSDTQFVQAADALKDAASALALLDLVLADYLEALEAPTPEELLNASKAIEAMNTARSELLEARAEAENLRLASASRHVLAALEQLDKATQLIRDAGVTVPTEIDRFIESARALAQRGANLQ